MSVFISCVLFASVMSIAIIGFYMALNSIKN